MHRSCFIPTCVASSNTAVVIVVVVVSPPIPQSLLLLLWTNKMSHLTFLKAPHNASLPLQTLVSWVRYLELPPHVRKKPHKHCGCCTPDPLPRSTCWGISPLGYWYKVNQLPTQTKPYNTLPPWNGGLVFRRAIVQAQTGYTGWRVTNSRFQFLGPQGEYLLDYWREKIHFSLKSIFMVDVRFELTTNDPWSCRRRHLWKALVRWATGKRLTNRLPKLSLTSYNISHPAQPHAVRKKMAVKCY